MELQRPGDGHVSEGEPRMQESGNSRMKSRVHVSPHSNVITAKKCAAVEVWRSDEFLLLTL